MTIAAAHGEDARSPYAGQQHRAIKALTPDRIAALLAGEGMGLARAAELNGLPGPRHVLDLAERLALTADQERRVRDAFGRMRDRAVRLGRRIVEVERRLDGRLAGGSADAAAVDALIMEIARLEGMLRSTHIRAHLTTAGVLTPDQIERYDELRGYSGPGGT